MRRRRGTYGLLAGALVASAIVLPGAPGRAAHNGDGPIALWTFDADSASVATDTSGHGHDGAITGALHSPLDLPTNGASALAFDGVGDQVVVPDAPDLDFGPGDAMTIAMWFKKTSTPGIYHLLGKRTDAGPMNYQLARDAGGFHFNSDAGRVDTSVNDLPVGVWTHAAVTYAPTANTLRVFVNGAEVGSRNGFVLGNANDAPLALGATAPVFGDRFPGSIDNVAIYRRTLSQQEVATLALANRWTPEGELRYGVDAANPSPDRFGNPGVWRYLEGPITTPRDPGTYAPLPAVTALPGWRSATPSLNTPEIWLSDGTSYQPGLNAHPEATRFVVIGWNSPVAGSLRVSGSFADSDVTCGDGVRWYVDQGAANLASGGFANGGSESFNVTTTVAVGDAVYLVLDPGAAGDFFCDNTVVDVTLTLIGSAVPPPPLGRIAFTADRDGNNEIYVMNADGSGQTRLTSIPGIDSQAAWSPNGARIAFASDPELDGDLDIYVMSADGSGLTRLTTAVGNDEFPSWSPAGDRIVFQSNRDANYEIYVMNADGTGQTNLTNSPTSADLDPDFSPDGTRVAFESNRVGNEEIFLMGADGSAPTNLTNHPATSDSSPAWSPDGTRIAFDSNRAGNDDVWVMAADGSGPQNVTASSAFDANPDWSPDGTRVAFFTNRDGNHEVYSVGVDGAGAANLSKSPAGDALPSWTGVASPPPPPPPPGAGMLEFSASAFDASENDATAEIRVTRSESTQGTVTVAFATIDGTARARSVRLDAALARLAPADYVRTSGTLVFTEGEREQTISVPIVDDTAIEGAETVNLVLSDPGNGAQLGAITTAVLTVADNDPSVAFAHASSLTTEGAGTARIDVTLSVTAPQDVTVDYAVTGGTAAFGSDHLLTNGTLRFRSRRSATTLVSVAIRVPLVDDERKEFAETLRLELSNPVNASLGSKRTHTLTIDDDDPNGDLAGDAPRAALPVDLVTQPRQVIDEQLPRRNDPADVYRVHLEAGDRLAIDVDPRVDATTGVDPLEWSTLMVLAGDGTTELARIGRSPEPDSGALSDNPAYLLVAPATGDYFLSLTTRDGGWNGYSIEFHRLALSQGPPKPAVLDDAGAMYAWLDGNLLALTGPTGYGFALEGAWTRQTFVSPRSGLVTTTYRLAAGETVTLHSALGALSVPVIEAITVPTARSTWGTTFGRVSVDSIRVRIGLPLGAWTNELNGAFAALFQWRSGVDIDTWYVELGDRIMRQQGVPHVLRGVPYLRASDSTLLPVHLKFGPIDFDHPGPLATPATVIADPADPYLYIKNEDDKTFVVAFSEHGHVPYRPQLRPTDPNAVGLTDFYGHTYFLAGGQLAEVAGLPLELYGGVLDDLDANDDGTWLAGRGNADQLARGDLSAIGDVLQDFNRGLEAELNVRIKTTGLDLKLPLGMASAVYNGLEGALWFRARTVNPFAGTPLSFLKAQNRSAEGVVYTDGRMSFTVETTLPLVGYLGPGLELLVHFDNRRIEAAVSGELVFDAGATIDGVGASCRVRAGVDGSVRFAYANRLRTAGSLRAQGRVRCFAGGVQVASASFEVGAAVNDRSITVDLPYVGDQTFDF